MTFARKYAAVSLPKPMGPSASPRPRIQPPWFHGPTTRRFTPSRSYASSAS